MYYYFRSAIEVVAFKYIYCSVTYTRPSILKIYIFSFCYTNATPKNLDRRVSTKTFAQ